MRRKRIGRIERSEIRGRERGETAAVASSPVIAGLDPAIHAAFLAPMNLRRCYPTPHLSMDARVKPAHDECGKSNRDVLLLGDAKSPKQNQIHSGRHRLRPGDRGFPPRARRSRAARGQRQGTAIAVAPQPRFLQTRSQEAPRAVPAHDPCAGGYICGAAGRRQSQVARMQRSEIRAGLRDLIAESRITLRFIRATLATEVCHC